MPTNPMRLSRAVDDRETRDCSCHPRAGRRNDSKARRHGRSRKELQSRAVNVEEKQRETRDKKKIIDERNAAADHKLSQMRVEDEVKAQRLMEFRDARDVAKKKLRMALEKLEINMKEESRKNKEEIQRAEERRKETEAQIANEDSLWQKHLIDTERQSNLEARVLLQEEKGHAQEGRKEYADMLHTIKDNGRRQQQLFQQIASLRVQLA